MMFSATEENVLFILVIIYALFCTVILFLNSKKYDCCESTLFNLFRCNATAASTHSNSWKGSDLASDWC